MASQSMPDGVAKHIATLMKVHSEARGMQKSLPLGATHIGDLISRDIAAAVGISSWRVVHSSLVFEHPQGHIDKHTAILNVRDAVVHVSIRVVDAIGPAKQEISSGAVAHRLLHSQYNSQNLNLLHHFQTTSTHKVQAKTTIVNSDDGAQNLSSGQIAGIVIGAAVFIAILVVGVVFITRRRLSQRLQQPVDGVPDVEMEALPAEA